MEHKVYFSAGQLEYIQALETRIAALETLYKEAKCEGVATLSEQMDSGAKVVNNRLDSLEYRMDKVVSLTSDIVADISDIRRTEANKYLPNQPANLE